MNRIQTITYISHLLNARHYRGHGIHSPYLYSFVRDVVIKKGDICDLISEKYSSEMVEVVQNAIDALNSNAYITILESPFRTKEEKEYWKANRPSMNILTVHLPHHMIIFRDKRLHNQHFRIRR